MNILPRAATFSKDPVFFGRNFSPTKVISGEGASIFGDDGHEYIDFISGLGAILLGNPSGNECTIASQWAEMVAGQVFRGAGFSLPHVLEEKVAEKIAARLARRVPGWSNADLGLRFGLSGTDATTMAVRLARAVTGHSKVLSIGYHGWSSEFVGATEPAWGVVDDQQIYDVRFNDMKALGAWSNSRIAAVIVEQTMDEPCEGYYANLRSFCDDHKALLILDEVVTGLRFGLGGAAARYDVYPDIVCYGKGLGNGIPISCMVGYREYFEWFERSDPVFVSSTHFGNAVSLASANAVLDLFSDWHAVTIGMHGAILQKGLRSAGYDVWGQPERFLIRFSSLSEKAYFTIAMRNNGVLWNRPTLVNLAHTRDDINEVVSVATKIKGEMNALGADKLEALMKDELPLVLFANR